ncbi:hypothetical protein QUF31_16990 [Dickeya chrysanthemi]|uniref:hypothetical protein n=1 Tax=Dickeya chrysanthemi TaxID=556 RepID=UPI00039ACFBF|nr:hypothetical protein [Dickeya chrysanthemi]WJM84803.1 hypothetical protein QUF31_16990 [Dickeya chrysanthemi]
MPVAIALFVALHHSRLAQARNDITATVDVRDLQQTVLADGTVNARKLVSVGAQVRADCGVLGMLSLLASAIASRISGVTFVYSAPAMAREFFCSGLIGVIFGFFPARQAARLQPIHTLEREQPQARRSGGSVSQTHR